MKTLGRSDKGSVNTIMSHEDSAKALKSIAVCSLSGGASVNADKYRRDSVKMSGAPHGYKNVASSDGRGGEEVCPATRQKARGMFPL